MAINRCMMKSKHEKTAASIRVSAAVEDSLIQFMVL